jgi:ribose transport system substrate-binding protein
MKRTPLLATAAAAVASLGLGACGSSSGSGSGSGTSAKTGDMVISTLTNPFFISLKNGAQAEATKDGFTLNVQNANNSDASELDAVSTDMIQKPGVLILDPTSSTAATSSVNSANSANIPVVAFDRQPTAGKIKAFVGYNAIDGGRRTADALAKGIHDKGNVVEIEGILGTNVAQDRHIGFRQEIVKYPNIHIVATQSGNFDRATALDVMTNILEAHPTISGVYAANDEMALGVLAALQAKNLVGKVIVVGNDGIEQVLAAIQSGQMYATNGESAYAEGQRVADLAYDVLKDKPIAKASTTLEGQLVTKANLAAYAHHLVQIGDSADVPAALR